MKLNADYLKYASMSAAERDKADAYAGPDKSFPLYKDGAHLKAAWDLAGHAADPAAVRARIRSFAREHGLEGHLPGDAKKDIAKKAIAYAAFEMTVKAKNEDLKNLFQMAYGHEQNEGDTYQQRQLVHFAQENGLTHLLPESAHGLMHDMYIPHSHEGMANDEHGMHSHEMVKHQDPEPQADTSVARKAVHDAAAYVHKAWEVGSLTYSEGWISTPAVDLQGERYEPEAFIGAIADYMACGGPHSSEHNTDDYPVGHVQQIAVVRDGAVLKAARHPDDPADFEHFPQSGSGLYARVVYTDPKAALAVKAGNMRSYSWIGKPTKRDAVDSKHVLEVYPLVETTSAAYPVNQRAAMVAAKAQSGAEPHN